MIGLRTGADSIATRFAPVMVISPTLPTKDLKGFIALLKANPGKFSYASSGAGTALHLGVELFKQKAGVDILHVPYRGTAAAMPDLLSGRIAMMLDGVPVQTPNIRAGTLSAVAVTTRQRSPAIPEVPTMMESGSTLSCRSGPRSMRRSRRRSRSSTSSTPRSPRR